MQQVREKLLTKFSDPAFLPLLVIVDDLDRLDDGEIQLFIRLIKANLNFPKLHYLILGDRDQIARALNPISGGQGVRFLDKIVQNPLVVPEPAEDQLRGRLWDGLDKIAGACHYPLGEHSRRFDSFWNDFLGKRLLTLRDIHRLVKVHAFHAGCLFNQGALEVDLLDLLAIDFLRLYASPLYAKIARNPPTTWWCKRHAQRPDSPGKPKDSQAALEFLENAGLPAETAAAALVHLFPGFWNTIQDFMQTWGNRNRPLNPRHLEERDRPVCSERYVSLYFQLDLTAANLPQHAYERFKSLRHDPLQMSSLLQEWSQNGWRHELLRRICDDELFYAFKEDVRPLLKALAWVSDDLSAGMYPSELDLGIKVFLKLFERVAVSARENFAAELAKDSQGVTIPLALIESLKKENALVRSSQGEDLADSGTGRFFDTGKLADLLYPQACERFSRRLFPKGDCYRWYLMADALGPERVERILVKSGFAGDDELSWPMLEAIADVVMQATRTDPRASGSLETPCHAKLAQELSRFAAAGYWSGFVSRHRTAKREPGRETLFQHIAKAYPGDVSRSTAKSAPKRRANRQRNPPKSPR
jgi:hypothetical protein